MIYWEKRSSSTSVQFYKNLQFLLFKKENQHLINFQVLCVVGHKFNFNSFETWNWAHLIKDQMHFFYEPLLFCTSRNMTLFYMSDVPFEEWSNSAMNCSVAQQGLKEQGICLCTARGSVSTALLIHEVMRGCSLPLPLWSHRVKRCLVQMASLALGLNLC